MQLRQLSTEFLAIRDMLIRLAGIDPSLALAHRDEDRREAFVNASFDRMSELVATIIDTHAGSTQELTCKARVALDWIDEEGDVADRLAASICRDILVLFEAAP